MNQFSALESEWPRLKGQVRKQWGRLNFDEVEQIRGDVEFLMDRLQARYALTREQAHEEVQSFLMARADVTQAPRRG